MNEKAIYALGFFDGVHMGHGALLRACRAMADEAGCRAAAVTFDTHPDTLVAGVTPGLLNTAADRERLMKDLYQIDEVLTLPFDRAMMEMPWQTFFQMLLRRYQAAGLVCGSDFRFGSRCMGNAEKLKAACGQAGIPGTVIPEQKIRGVTVSSTYIRSLLERGEMALATEYLGHPHIFTGVVVPGKHLGRTIGIPTANLILPKQLLCPRFGVYACKAVVDGTAWMAVTNVGVRPTVNGGNVTVEPWLLDFDGDLYGREITLEFYRFLRPERKFPSLEALREEIQKNAGEVREFFGKK